MKKIVNVGEAVTRSKDLREQRKVIVLAGGCFDILHVGHIAFLEEAKKNSDILFVLLESDATVGKIKGKDRPINTQEDRARVLAALSVVDYVVLLPRLETNQQYDDLVSKIRPAIIATTKNDPEKQHKQRQAKKIGATVTDVVTRVRSFSSTRLSKLLKERML